MQQLMSRLPAPSSSSRKKRKNRKRKNPVPRNAGIANGELRLSKMELVEAVKATKATGMGNGSFKLIVTALPFLKSIGGSFERIKWLKCRVMYKPLVGTVRDGGVTIGIDWNFKDPQSTRSKIACYTPTQSGPVFKDFSLNLPANKLQSRLWFLTTAEGFDGGPGIVVYAVEGCTSKDADVTVGEIWVDYTVVLSGTQA